MAEPWTENIILTSDSYKISHWRQYPKGTEYVYSYFESRGCDNEGWDSVVFFGLQYFLKRYMTGQVVSQAKIEDAAAVYAEHFGDGVNKNEGMFYREGWEHILKAHGGKLPLSIKAVPEGMVIPNKTVLMTIVNTDPKAYWLTNFMETLLVQVWYPMTVATNSRQQKISIHKYLEETGNEEWAIPGGAAFKLHDFGFRGVSSVESAALGGMGHLVNFMGTDTVAALVAATKYYYAPKACGYSVPASEHSTITSWGVDGELDAMRNMLEQYPTGIVACVSDSFDVYNACQNYWGDSLKEMIKGRISGDAWGRLVVRPDSGDPAEICLAIVRILCTQFSEDVTTTKTGHQLLPPYIRVLQGDGVDWKSIPEILKNLADHGYAAENMVFGSGGALLQKLNRDTFKCAFKCAEITVNGEARDVFKDPITDNGKASKKGRLTLQLASETTGFTQDDIYVARQGAEGVKGGTGCLHFSKDEQYVTVADGRGDPAKDVLVEVFRNGDILKEYKMEEIRRVADIEGGPFKTAAAAQESSKDAEAAEKAVDGHFADRAEADKAKAEQAAAPVIRVSRPSAGYVPAVGGVYSYIQGTSPAAVVRPGSNGVRTYGTYTMPAVDPLSRSLGRTFVNTPNGYVAGGTAPVIRTAPAVRSSSFVGATTGMVAYKSAYSGAPQPYSPTTRPGNVVSYTLPTASSRQKATTSAPTSYISTTPTSLRTPVNGAVVQPTTVSAATSSLPFGLSSQKVVTVPAVTAPATTASN